MYANGEFSWKNCDDGCVFSLNFYLLSSPTLAPQPGSSIIVTVVIRRQPDTVRATFSTGGKRGTQQILSAQAESST